MIRAGDVDGAAAVVGADSMNVIDIIGRAHCYWRQRASLAERMEGELRETADAADKAASEAEIICRKKFESIDFGPEHMAAAGPLTI